MKKCRSHGFKLMHFSLVYRKKREEMALGKNQTKKKEHLLSEREENKGTFYGMGHLGLPCPFPPATQISV